MSTTTVKRFADLNGSSWRSRRLRSRGSQLRDVLFVLAQSRGKGIERRGFRGGLHAFAIDHDPVPRPLGVLQVVAANVVDLHVVGNAAILGDRSAGVVVIDVADPTAPRHIATVDVRTAPGSDDTMEVRAVGRRGSDVAVVGAGSGGHQLILYDASDPASLVELGRTDIDGASNARGAAWLGDHVYSGSSSYGLHPVNVSDLAAPRALDLVPRPEDVRVSGVHEGADRLYQWAHLGMEGAGLVEYALDDPARPALVTIHRDGPWGGVHAAGKRLYSWTNIVRTADSAALGIYERADDGALNERGGIHLSLGVVDAVWRGRGGLPSDLMVFDAGRAEGPVVLGTLPVLVGWNGLAPLLPVDDVLLIGSDGGETQREIAIVDVRDAAAPVEIHHLPMVDHVWALTRSQGGTVYAGTDTALIQFELTSEPPFLVERARWRAGEEGAEREVRAVTVVGDDVHVLLSFGTDPSTSSRPADANGYQAAVRTLRAGTDGKLRVIDEVPVPVNFFYSSTYDIVATASHLGVVGSTAGFTILGQAGERGAGLLYLPLLWRNDPGR